MSYRFPDVMSEQKFFIFFRNYQPTLTTLAAGLIVLNATALQTPTSVAASKLLLDTLFSSPPTVGAFGSGTRFPAPPVEVLLKTPPADEYYEDALRILALNEPIFGQEEWNQINSSFSKFIDLANPNRLTVDRAYFEACLGILFV